MAVFLFCVCVCVQRSPELQGKKAVCVYGASAIIKGGHYGEKQLIVNCMSLIGNIPLI